MGVREEIRKATKSSLFEDAFLDTVREDPIGAVIEICDRGLSRTDRHPESLDDDDLNALLEAYALLMEMEAGDLIQLEVREPDLNGEFHEDFHKLSSFLRATRAQFIPRRTERLLQDQRARFRRSLSTGFLYEFTQGDLERIQVLLNELRSHIAESTLFEAEHKRRLLLRLEKLQSEMHKKVSDLDRFWGLVGDAGVVLGKFGSDVKPIVDRVREIVDIVWRTQSRAEELPSGTKPPLIEDKSEE